MSSGEHTKIECAEVVPNQNVRAAHRSTGEQRGQFVGNIQTTARLIGRVTSTKTSAIVGTNTRKPADRWLNQVPNNRGVIWTGLQDDDGTSRARTVDVKVQPTGVDEFARRRITMAFPFRHRKLIYGAGSDDQSH
jgi:hypothetical protein